MDEQIKGIGGLKMEIKLAPVSMRALANITAKRIAKNHESAEDMLIAHYKDRGISY
jgi:hypothetical protein